jgi:hypothetical protein
MKSTMACIPSGLVIVALAIWGLGAGLRMAPAAEPPRSNPIADAFVLIFDSESIRLHVVADSLEVRGTYTLLCREPYAEPIALFYPFPQDSLLGGARMVSLVIRAGSAAAMPGRWEDPGFGTGVRWWMPPCPGDSLVAEAVYRQQLKTDYARYIVTTTRIWGRPLRHAAFEINLPPGAVAVEFSFPFERREVDGRVFYAFATDNFFPDHDVVVRWQR